MYSKTFLNYRTKKAIRKDQLKRDSIGFNEARYFGILFTADSEEKFTRIKSLVKDLEDLGKNIEVISYLPKGKTNFEFLFNIFTSQDISFFGKFTNDDVNKFIQKKFDYLLCLDVRLHPVIENIIAMSQAHCRVGRYDEIHKDMFEFMISQDESKTYIHLIDEISRYLKTLTKESAYV